MMLEFSQKNLIILLALATALAACNSGGSSGDLGSESPENGPPPASPVNGRPTVHAGADRTVTTGSLVTLNGEGTDPDGDVLTFAWALASEPPGALTTLNHTDRPNMSFRPSVSGLYTFRLTAHDGTVASEVDTVHVTSDNGQSSAEFFYLDDANKSAPSAASGAPSIEHHLFPRMYLHEVQGPGVTPEMMSKYQFIVAHGPALDKTESVQAHYSPETLMLRHYSGRAYQSYGYKPCHVTGGIAFESTGPVTEGGPSSAGCAVYAGHWLYKAGTRLASAAAASALTLALEDASKVQAGQYVVIYDAPAGSFRNAEHARVVARNLGSNTITVQSRGHKSSPTAHPAGSIVAQHVLGQGSDPQLWAYNMTSRSPRDGAGRTFPQFYARWLHTNLTRHRNGEESAAAIAGILFDADFYFELASAAPDADNDLLRDDALDGRGNNWLGEGLDDFYSMLRSLLPNHYLMTGVYEARGYEWAQGTEMENWLDYGNGDFKGDPQYRHLNSMISTYLFNMAERELGAPLVHNLTKTATRLYPGVVNPPPASNAPFRLGLTLTLMDGGYFGTHSRYTPDAWWDEYAVDVMPGSVNFGRAVNEHSAGAVRDHRGWLGSAQGPFRRIFDEAEFAKEESLTANGTFDANLAGWTSSNVTIERVTAGSLDGAGSLRTSTMHAYHPDLAGAHVKSGNLPLVAGRDYTIAFAARATSPRTIRIRLGSHLDRYTLGTQWRRYVIGFTQTRDESKPLYFYLGREDLEVELDSVFIFEGNANVFRRDFDNGIALANATSRSRTVELGGRFLRINGTQDPAVNSGASVTTVTLPPYDGLLLVRPR